MSQGRWIGFVLLVGGIAWAMHISTQTPPADMQSAGQKATQNASIASEIALKSEASNGPLAVDFEIAPSFGRPTIEGRTNLPDGTELGVWLFCLDGPKPRMNCGTSLGATVSNGHFVADFSTFAPENAVIPGIYRLEVTTSGVEPPAVAAVLGQRGENLAGKYVVRLIPGVDVQTIKYSAQIVIGGAR